MLNFRETPVNRFMALVENDFKDENTDIKSKKNVTYIIKCRIYHIVLLGNPKCPSLNVSRV